MLLLKHTCRKKTYILEIAYQIDRQLLQLFNKSLINLFNKLIITNNWPWSWG